MALNYNTKKKYIIVICIFIIITSSLAFIYNSFYSSQSSLKAEIKYFGLDFAPQKHLFEKYGIL